MFKVLGVIFCAVLVVGCSRSVSSELERRDEEAKVALVRSHLEVIESALHMFRLDKGAYPERLEDLAEYCEGVPRDPWTKAPYAFDRSEDRIVIVSLGADQRKGGTGFDQDLTIEVPIRR